MDAFEYNRRYAALEKALNVPSLNPPTAEQVVETAATFLKFLEGTDG